MLGLCFKKNELKKIGVSEQKNDKSHANWRYIKIINNLHKSVRCKGTHNDGCVENIPQVSEVRSWMNYHPKIYVLFSISDR